MAKGKTTHEIEHVEGMIFDRLDILQNGKTKQEKRKARSEIIYLEKHLNGVNDKDEKVYPERMKGFPDDVPMDKEAVLKLIDSVETIDYPTIPELQNQRLEMLSRELDLEGGSPVKGEKRFNYQDKGWPKAKEPKQGKLT